MKLLVDADACPVLAIIEEITQCYQLELIIFCDMNHALQSEIGQVKMIDQGADAVDFALLKETSSDDIVITQDYGLATLVLSKQAIALHPDGRLYDENNIDEMLFGRYLGQKQRKSKQKQHLKGPKKRSEEDNQRFYTSLIQQIETKIKT